MGSVFLMQQSLKLKPRPRFIPLMLCSLWLDTFRCFDLYFYHNGGLLGSYISLPSCVLVSAWLWAICCHWPSHPVWNCCDFLWALDIWWEILQLDLKGASAVFTELDFGAKKTWVRIQVYYLLAVCMEVTVWPFWVSVFFRLLLWGLSRVMYIQYMTGTHHRHKPYLKYMKNLLKSIKKKANNLTENQAKTVTRQFAWKEGQVFTQQTKGCARFLLVRDWRMKTRRRISHP